MDAREHARSSSSPSVKIQSLSRRKNGRPGEEIHVTLSDASSFFVAIRVWEEAPFHEDDELNESRWEEILQRTNLVRARSIALSLLARSEHSRFLLDRKLRQRDLTSESIAPVLDELEEGGELSDARYAESWVRTRVASHPEGRAHLVAGLRERGVAEQVARAAVDLVLQETDRSMDDVARSLVERLTRRKQLEPDALRTRLYRRGFARDVVNRVVREADLNE